METFSALLAICAGNSPVPGEFPTKRPVTRSFDVFFDLRLNQRLSKQWWGWWFETLSRPLWRQLNEKRCGICLLLPRRKCWTIKLSVIWDTITFAWRHCTFNYTMHLSISQFKCLSLWCKIHRLGILNICNVKWEKAMYDTCGFAYTWPVTTGYYTYLKNFNTGNSHYPGWHLWWRHLVIFANIKFPIKR